MSEEDQAFSDLTKLTTFNKKGSIRIIEDDGLSHSNRKNSLMSIDGLNERVILIQSKLGSGKTFQAKRLIPDYRRCLWISSTVVLARETTNDEPLLKNYLDHKMGKDLSKYDRIVTLIPSLYKFGYESKNYDLVIIDEIESVLEEIQSKICRDRSEDI